MTQINNIANPQYAKELSNDIKILNELRKINLLEEISGVKLPKSDGTCTHCVMELRLVESFETCSCQASLRK
ncbi:31510_t:CDS:2 [Gigaspora margarita]|uniref:31510_t:CDS:1 n=1 Tax=Gigaspora margarita TaxID=4874 RepID=A0ABN7UXT3_GIGMA|nr:31510_t:CDS:2 [Gigaspora margarita]